MEMCYDGALVMPSSYVMMDEDEMTYVEGGKYLEAKHTLGHLKNKLGEMCIASGIGFILSGLGTVLQPGLFIATDLLFGFLLEKISQCYSKVDRWIASDKYTKKTVGYIGINFLAFIITDISVSLTPN